MESPIILQIPEIEEAIRLSLEIHGCTFAPYRIGLPEGSTRRRDPKHDVTATSEFYIITLPDGCDHGVGCTLR